MNEKIDPITGMPIDPNRAGMPSRSINDLQAINTIQDPGMQSAQQANAFQRFNNVAQYMPPSPATKTEKVYQADAGKSDYSDSYGTQTSYKKTKKDSSGKVESTASADLTTGKGNTFTSF